MMRSMLPVVLCLWGATALAEEVTLARGGKPACTIVVPATADPKLALAASELQRCVKGICGVELPIKADGKKADGPGLYIGQCEATTEADLPGKEFNPETYAIRVRDGDVLFAGRWATPTYFAVVSFIEDNLGVRWFAPGDLWESVPQGRPGELVVQVKNVVKSPDTSPRVWSGHAWTESWKTWNLRNKTVLSEVVPRRQFQNAMHRVFPPEKYAKEHPEYYPLIKGTRWIPAPNASDWRPCESNPEVLRLTVEYARKWFDDNPTIDSFSLGMDDIGHLCSCPSCRALDARPDSYEKREFSDRHYKFVNAVAREIKKSHSDRYIGTLIYSIVRKPPETVDRLEDNVFGFITETSARWWEEGVKDADHALTREWAGRCKHLSRYDYYGMGTMTPRVYPHTMAEQIKFDKSLGLDGMYTEVYTFLPHTAPMIWAFAKLQWDHTLNVDDLLNEFYAKMYGAAAPVMKEYFDLLERSWNTPRVGRRGWVHRNITNQALAMSAEDLDAAFILLEKASAQADGPKVKARIEVSRGALQYSGYVIRTYALSRKLIEMDVRDERSAEEALALAEQLERLGSERTEVWAEAPKRDDLLGETLRGLGGINYLVTSQIAHVECGGLLGVMKALAWYSQHAPDQLAPALKRFSGGGTGPVAEAIRAWVSVQESKPQNLVSNPGFESATKNTGKAEKDWKTEGAPEGWSIWSRSPDTELRLIEGKGRNGSTAGAIRKAQSACYLQSFSVRPGERLLCVCWAKADPPGRHSGARLTVRFRDAKGGWHKRQDLEPTVYLPDVQNDWQPLILSVTAPDGAGSLALMLCATDQDEGACALFDDVSVYRIGGAP